MALDYIDSFDHAQPGLYEGVTGVSPQVQFSTTRPRTGTYSLRLAPNGAAIEVAKDVPAVARRSARFRANVDEIPTTGSFALVLALANGGRWRVLLNANVNLQIVAAVEGGTSQSAGNSFTVDNWITIDVDFDVSGTTYTARWSVNGVAQTDCTLAGQTATTITQIRYRYEGTATDGIMYVDDVASDSDGTNYPVAVGDVALLPLNGVGTHNLDAATSQFYSKDVGGTESAITTSETTSHQVLDDSPLANDNDHIIIRPQTPSSTFADPNGNGTATAWTGTFTAVDEGVRQPSTPGGDTISGTTTDETAETLTFTDPTFVSGATYRLWVYGSGGNKRAIDCAYSVNNADPGLAHASRAQLIAVNDGPGWFSRDLTIANQTELTNLRVEFITNTVGSGGGASAPTIDAVYVEIIPTASAPTTAHYVEHTITDPSATPLAVRVINALRNESGTGANKISAKLREGGSDAAIYTDFSIASTTTIYKTAVFTTKPSGGAWTTTALTNTTHRWGFTNDVAVNPRLESAALEVAYADTTTISKSGGATSASTGSGVGSSSTAGGGTFPTTGILTNATGADEDPISEAGEWSWPINGTNNSLKRSSNHIMRGSQNAAAIGQAYLDGQTYGPDCEVYATMLLGEVNVTPGESYGVIARIQNPQTGSINGYFASWKDGTGWRIFKCVAGTFTQIGSTVTGFNPVDGDKIGLECIGTSIKFKHYTGGAWVDRISVTDSGVTGAGYIGLEMVGTTVQFDDMGGGTVTSGGTVSKSGGATSGSVGSGSRAIRHAKQNVATSASTGSGARAIKHAKQNTAISASTGSGSKNILRTYAKAGNAVSVSTGSGARATRSAKTGLATSGSIGSGAGLKTVLISRSGSATSGSVGSGSRAYRIARSGVALSAGAGSGSKAFRAAKAGLGQSGSVGSGSRAYRLAKSGVGISGSIGSGARTYSFSRTGGATSILTGSGAKAARYVKTGVGIAVGFGSGEGSVASATGKTGRGTSVGIGSGSKTLRYAKSGGATSSVTGSGSKIKTISRSGLGQSAATGSGARAFRVAKSGIGISPTVGSGFRAGTSTHSKSGGAISVAIGSGSKATRYALAGAATSVAIGSGTRSLVYSRTGIGITEASGLFTKAIRFGKSGVGISAGRGSGVVGGVATYSRSGGAVSASQGSGAKTFSYNRQGAGISTGIGSGTSQWKVEKFVLAISEATGSGKLSAGVLVIGYDPTVGVIGSRGHEPKLIATQESAQAIGTLGEI